MTHAGGRQAGQGRPSPAEQRRPAVKARRGLRAHPGTPEQAWIPEHLRGADPREAEGAAVEAMQLPSEGQAHHRRELSLGALSSSKIGYAQAPPLWTAAPTHSEKGGALSRLHVQALPPCPPGPAGQTVTPSRQPQGADGHHHL